MSCRRFFAHAKARTTRTRCCTTKLQPAKPTANALITHGTIFPTGCCQHCHPVCAHACVLVLVRVRTACAVCHRVASHRLVSPRFAPSRPVSPRRALPSVASLHLTTPHLTLPHLTTPHLTLPYRTAHCLATPSAGRPPGGPPSMPYTPSACLTHTPYMPHPPCPP